MLVVIFDIKRGPIAVKADAIESMTQHDRHPDDPADVPAQTVVRTSCPNIKTVYTMESLVDIAYRAGATRPTCFETVKDYIARHPTPRGPDDAVSQAAATPR